jgi:hypothetical protein
MSTKLRNSIKKLNQDFLENKKPADLLKKEVVQFCQKIYIFDMIAALPSLKELSIYTIEVIIASYLRTREKLGWLLLCAQLPPYEDPINWEPDSYDFQYFQIMLEFLKKSDLSSDEFQELAEYHLRILVDNLLMSGAFWGCGGENIKKWSTQEFYNKLLSQKKKFDLEAEHTSIEFTENIITSVAQLFEKHRLERLKLYISSAESYYGLSDRIKKTKVNFINWLFSQELTPFLVDLVINNFLVPENGLLIPNWLLS